MKRKDYLFFVIALLPLISLLLQLMKISLIHNYQSLFSIVNIICILFTIAYSIILVINSKKKNNLQKTILILSIIYILTLIFISFGVIINMFN
ncbi:amino acid transporter [Staphylococcus hominis]